MAKPNHNTAPDERQCWMRKIQRDRRTADHGIPPLIVYMDALLLWGAKRHARTDAKHGGIGK